MNDDVRLSVILHDHLQAFRTAPILRSATISEISNARMRLWPKMRDVARRSLEPALDDGRLPDGLSDQNRIVLGAAARLLDALDFVLSAARQVALVLHLADSVNRGWAPR
jgi:hypothetical protein